jgi:hypothetical protein
MSSEFQLQEKSQSVPVLAYLRLMRHCAANEHTPETVPSIVDEVLRSPSQPLDLRVFNKGKI